MRDGQLELDNGNCHESASLEFYSGHAPSRRANCKPNEVDVPARRREDDRVRAPAARRRSRSRRSTSTSRRSRGSGSTSSSAQFPSDGTLSSYDDVTLVLPRALHGVVPNVVGLDLRHARQKLLRVALEPARHPVLRRRAPAASSSQAPRAGRRGGAEHEGAPRRRAGLSACLASRSRDSSVALV